MAHCAAIWQSQSHRTGPCHFTPPEGMRKIVLATPIAETSLTIEGIRVVADSGLQRTPRFDPGSGLTRLVTVPISRASADQRRGRAGRTAPGLCLRMWSGQMHSTLSATHRPEILEADLAGTRFGTGHLGCG
jgi:ATP-dependent helicase HrpB